MKSKQFILTLFTIFIFAFLTPNLASANQIETETKKGKESGLELNSTVITLDEQQNLSHETTERTILNHEDVPEGVGLEKNVEINYIETDIDTEEESSVRPNEDEVNVDSPDSIQQELVTQEKLEDADQDSGNNNDSIDFINESHLISDDENEVNTLKEKSTETIKLQSMSLKVNVGVDEIELKRGVRDQKVVQLKSNLAKLGFSVPGNGTNLYGEQTENKVREFQKYYGIRVTGTVDQETEDKINEILSSPLQKGNRNEDTIQLKEDLAFLGLPVPGNHTDFFGSETEKKVKDFQKRNTLIVNGIVDFITLNKIQELIKAPLSNGTRREDVKTLKSNLEKLGFRVPGSGTNLYGEQTETKVREFQSYYGIGVTGIANDQTMNKLNEILSSPLQKGKRHQNTVQLKRDLAFLGLSVPGSGTDLYGTQTENRVIDFQKRNNLVVNGIADSVTLNKIQELVKAPLSNGTRREDVKTLKSSLEKVGFRVPGSGTNLYGKQTETKVREFQRYYGLSVTGIANDQTTNKLNEILSSPLQNGKRHQDTIALKDNLKKLGFTVPGSGTNLYGKQTEKQVRNLQAYYGLTVNGIADEVTLKKINNILASPLQNGKRHKGTIVLKDNLKKLGFTVPGNGTNFYGKQTENKVRNLQAYYGLTVNGIADEVTLSKIDNILASPLQNGKRHRNTVQLKNDLALIGFAVPGTGTNLYGNQTEKKVRDFQKANNLAVNGIADEVTLKTIAQLVKKAKSSIKIFIDPGHGGKDPGASGHGLREKDIVLDIAKRLEKHLKKYSNVEIKLSRTTDVFFETEERAKMANDWGADYFVSIHTNSFTKASANGFETFIHNGNRGTADAKAKQKIIHEQIVGNISTTDRGMKSANFSVLRNATMSSILLEYLFISNKQEADKLGQSSYRDRLARLTAEGIAQAFNLKRK